MITALIFTGGLSPAQIIIQIFTWSIWAHVAIELDSGEIIDATMTLGVTQRKRKTNRTGWTKRIPLAHIPRDERSRAIDKARAEVGKPYDIPWLFDYAFDQSGRWNEPSAWVCSELIWHAFERFRTKPQARISPKNIAAAASRSLARINNAMTSGGTTT